MQGEVGCVLFRVDARSGAVILAEGVDAARLVAALPVGGEGARVERAERAVLRPFRQEAVEIGEGIAADLPFRLGRGPGEERPMRRRRLAGADLLPHQSRSAGCRGGRGARRGPARRAPAGSRRARRDHGRRRRSARAQAIPSRRSRPVPCRAWNRRRARHRPRAPRTSRSRAGPCTRPRASRRAPARCGASRHGFAESRAAERAAAPRRGCARRCAPPRCRSNATRSRERGRLYRS